MGVKSDNKLIIPRLYLQPVTATNDGKGNFKISIGNTKDSAVDGIVITLTKAPNSSAETTASSLTVKACYHPKGIV